MKKTIQILTALVIFLASLCPITPVRAGQLPAGRDFDPAEMESFFDEYLGTQMEANHVAGATVAVVKDGQVLFTKGYGYADVEQGISVDPEKTIFILGSLSKLFTWTAVMQLVERGQLDLDVDVNTYLDFEIPATYPQPITLNHLMAHNAGFEDNKFSQMAATPDGMIPLGEWLKAHIPARIYPPGQFSAYSNYGTALAGYIVERVSGMSYDDYVEKNILTPLGMAQTTSRQPMPASLSTNFSQGYIFDGSVYQSQPRFNVAANVAPAASFVSSAGDMARFMLAHLDDGSYGDAVILREETARLMHSRSFSHDPRVNGMAHGFWEMDMNGQQIIGHAGSHFIFSSCLMLFPEQNLGVFLAVNSQGGMAFVGGQNYLRFEQAFVDHFFPQEFPTLTPPADFAQRAGRFAGSYHLTMGRSESTPEKLSAMLMSVGVKADRDGLTVPMLGNAHFIEVEPLVFRQMDDDTLLVFKEDGAGNITQAFLGTNAQSALIKNRWFEDTTFNLILLAVWFVLFLSFEIAEGIRLLSRRKNPLPEPSNRLERSARRIAGLTGFLGLLVLAGAFASVFDIYGLYVGSLPLWRFIPATSVIVALLTLAMIVFTVLAWLRGIFGTAGRVHYTLVTLGAVGQVWFMYFWNILGRGF